MKGKRQKLGNQGIAAPQQKSDAAPQSSENTSHFPIDRLPRDILAEIFVQCLPEAEPWPGTNGKSSKDVAPLLLCNVCSSWRTLALSIPQLWQALFLFFTWTMSKSKETEDAVDMIHVWIKRSGVLPLTLNLFVETLGPTDIDAQALVNAIFNALADYLPRWENVNFRFYGPRITLPQFGHVPCLRGFRMRTVSPEDLRFPFASCPKLSRISWPFKCTISTAPLSWVELKHLDLGHTTSQEILFIIRSCPNLIDFIVGISENDRSGSLPRGSIVNNSLEKLQLQISRSCGPLIKRLTLPALIDISFDFDPQNASTHGFHKELLHFFSRSKCKLDRLDLQECGFNGAELLKCLKHRSCTSLVELRVSNVYHRPMLTDSVLLALTDDSYAENSMLLPQLARLSLRSCLSGSAGRLGTMVLSRCISRDEEDRLQNLYIHYQEVGGRDSILLRLAEKQGLDVTITSNVRDLEGEEDEFRIIFY